jgi:hypothetical protein
MGRRILIYEGQYTLQKGRTTRTQAQSMQLANPYFVILFSCDSNRTHKQPLFNAGLRAVQLTSSLYKVVQI